MPSIHGACFDNGMGGSCEQNEDFSCSEDCTAYSWLVCDSYEKYIETEDGKIIREELYGDYWEYTNGKSKITIGDHAMIETKDCPSCGRPNETEKESVFKNLCILNESASNTKKLLYKLSIAIRHDYLDLGKDIEIAYKIREEIMIINRQIRTIVKEEGGE